MKKRTKTFAGLTIINVIGIATGFLGVIVIGDTMPPREFGGMLLMIISYMLFIYG